MMNSLSAVAPSKTEFGGFDAGFSLPTERMVAACGVSEMLGEVRCHHIKHALINGRGGVVVKVYWKLQSHRLILCSLLVRV